LRYLGEIPFDPTVEAAIGSPKALLDTEIGKQIRKIVADDLKPR
jgi:hypothetical protein